MKEQIELLNIFHRNASTISTRGNFKFIVMLVTLVQAAAFFCFRWALLPSMFVRKHFHSAMFVGDEDDVDVAILVVGGLGGTGKEAGLLSRRSNHASRDPEIQWRWQQLTPMHESRSRRPGMLLLGRDRVLVAGGESRSAEILQLPLNDNDSGVWTRIRMPLTKNFFITFLVNFNDRTLAFG